MDTLNKPTLEGNLITLRPIGSQDAEGMWETVNDSEGNQLTGTHATFTKEQIVEWCESLAQKEGRVDLAIIPKTLNEYAGEVVLNNIDQHNRSASFRIAMRGVTYCNKGWGSEATRLMLGYGFKQLGLHRIELEVYSFNPRAIHVYEKVGFKREGVRRDVLYWDGTYYDAIVMAILENEYIV
jgi:RimJ/RimL family protein N-acetyltransferase